MTALTEDHYATHLPATLLRTLRHTFSATVDNEVVGFCFGSVGADGTEGFIDLIAVAPVWQGRNVGGRLLVALEERLHESGCRVVRVAGHPPVYAWPGVDHRYTRAICLFEGTGYRRDGVEVNMRVQLERSRLHTKADEQRLARSKISFRRARTDETDELREQLARDWKADWLTELAMAIAGSRSGAVLAMRHETCVGFCAYGLNRPNEVGPLGTAPALQRRGVGTVLIRRAMKELVAQGEPVAEIPWAGPLSFFARTLGAHVNRVFVTYHKSLA